MKQINIIAAIDEKRGIGKEGKLPWYIPEDLKHFKEITTGNTIIMGRKTFESIGKVLPNRQNIVVSRDQNLQIEGVLVVGSLQEAIEKAEKEIFIIGGGQIFKEAIFFADKLYLTLVEGDYACDAFFPDFSEFTNEIFIGAGQEGNSKYKFITLQK